MKPSPRSSIAKPSPAKPSPAKPSPVAMKSSIRSSTTKKLSTLLTTSKKPSSRRCMIPHISRNDFSPGRSSVRVEIAAPKSSQDYEYEIDDLDVLEENVPCLSEKADSWLQMPVHKMSSEGMNTMVVEGESDTDGNQIVDSTKERIQELSVAAMYDLLNVLEEDDPELQKPLPKKPSEGMTKMAVQDEARTHKNYKLFKLFDSFAKSEHHNSYSAEVSPPRDRGYLLYDFYGYDSDSEDDVSKPVNEGENSTPPRYNLRPRRSRTNTQD